MATVTVVISTGQQSFPAGTSFKAFRVTVAGQVQEVTDPVAVFPDVAEGDQLALAVAIDVNDQPLGAVVSQAFVVPPQAVSINVPQSLTITLS